MIAVLPTLVPAALGTLWYLGGLLPNDVDPGREFFAVPIYLVMWVVGMSVVAWLGGWVVRFTGSSAAA